MIIALVNGGLLSGFTMASRSGGAINISYLLFFFLISKRNIIKKRKAQSSTQKVYKKGI
jgi:energy-converting hydrogenase Eha subunit G